MIRQNAAAPAAGAEELRTAWLWGASARLRADPSQPDTAENEGLSLRSDWHMCRSAHKRHHGLHGRQQGTLFIRAE